MTYTNLIENIVQNIFDVWPDIFSIGRKLTDDQIKFMQFGVCGYAPRKVEEVHFFHY